MGCGKVTLKSGDVAIVCGRGRKFTKCHLCGDVATRLCDYKPKPRAKRCDRSLCEHCAVSVAPEIDYCPEHPTQLGLGLEERS